MGKIKLDKTDVATIRFLCEKTDLIDREIAEIFGVTRKHINQIRNKKRWDYEYIRDFDITRVFFHPEGQITMR